MNTFRKGQDILREVLTAKNMNEIGDAVRFVSGLRERVGVGDAAQQGEAVRCHCAVAIRAGDPVFPTGFADTADIVTPRGSLHRPLFVRKATTRDLAAGLWGIALESADASVSFRAAFFGLAVVVLPDTGAGDYLAPDDSGALVRTGDVSRCRILWTQEIDHSDDRSVSVAMVRLEPVSLFPAPLQWILSVETIPGENEDSEPTYRVRCAGGSVVVTDIAVSTDIKVDDKSASSSDGTDESAGGNGHDHAHGHGTGGGGSGPGVDHITVPGITYGV